MTDPTPRLGMQLHTDHLLALPALTPAQRDRQRAAALTVIRRHCPDHDLIASALGLDTP